MKQTKLFNKLETALQTDAQHHIDHFYKTWKTREPVLAFCFYFDSENGSVDYLLLPESRFVTHPDVSDIAAWAYAQPYVSGAKSDKFLELLEQYSELRFADDTTAEMSSDLSQNFVDLLLRVLNTLSFDTIVKHADFMMFAESIDEDWNLTPQTVDAKLRKKYFGGC